MKIKAAVLEEFESPLVVREVDLDAPKEGEALVRLEACALCHTDYTTAVGKDPSGYCPTVLGHEGAGVVEAIGPGVALEPGDHVLTLCEPECGTCVHCLSGRTNICLAIREQMERGYFVDGTTRLSSEGTPLRHYLGTSAFAEYTVVPEIALAKISPDAPLDVACLFACGYSTGLGAATASARVEQGASCVVLGAGVVGLGAIAGCRIQGAERIIAVDLMEERLEVALQQGATEVLRGGPDTVERILELTDGFGADYTFEATGKAEVMEQAVASARMGWGLATLCGVAGQGDVMSIVPRLLITGRRVMGCEIGGLRTRTEIPGLVEQWLDDRLDPVPLVTSRFALEDINQAFDQMTRNEGLRSVVTFD